MELIYLLVTVIAIIASLVGIGWCIHEVATHADKKQKTIIISVVVIIIAVIIIGNTERGKIAANKALIKLDIGCKLQKEKHLERDSIAYDKALKELGL